MPEPRVTSVSPGSMALLVVGVAGVSLSGPLMAAATAVPALAMALWRSGLGAVALGAYGGRQVGVDISGLSRRTLVRSSFAGLMLALHFATWITSLRYTSVASATALVCLQAAFVVLLARFDGEEVSRSVWMGVGLAFAGVLVVSGVDLSISTRALTGDLLALAGGVFGAVYTVVGSRVRRELTTTTYTVICYGTSAALLLVACLIGGVQVWGFDAKSWLLIGAVTVVAQLLGHTVFNHVLAVMSPSVVSMTILLEVPGAALLAAVLLGQAPPVAVYAGLGLIVSGLAVVVAARTRAGAPLEAPID